MLLHKKETKQDLRLISAVYLHIPFCRKICPFCSFAVRRDRGSLHESYLRGMVEEIRFRSEFLKSKDSALQSIYFGGGTPSRLTLAEVAGLLTNLRKYFSWSEETEVTFEMNPEDVTLEYLQGLAEIGVNRLSLGGQSFQASTLRNLGRLHTAPQLCEAITAIVNSPLKNWNLDLMFGIPKQSFALFRNDLEEALSHDPPHLSLYGLEIHEYTAFGHNPQIRTWETEHQEQFEEMYLWAVERLAQAGLFQYEVSNFSGKGWEGRNNLAVWSGKEYLGFGVGAHSYYAQTRRGNVRSIRTYLRRLKNGTWPTEFEEQLSRKKQASEFLMLGLRRPQGVQLEDWSARFGTELSTAQKNFIRTLCESGRAYRKGRHLCLTPKGMLLADAITAELMPSIPSFPNSPVHIK